MSNYDGTSCIKANFIKKIKDIVNVYSNCKKINKRVEEDSLFLHMKKHHSLRIHRRMMFQE